jgi:RND family efflux transporter MFP subunit
MSNIHQVISKSGRKTGVIAILLIGCIAITLSVLDTTHTEVIKQPQAKSALTVTIAPAQLAHWSSTLNATGAIAAWQEASIGAQINGLKLIEVLVNIGDSVKKGQLLARFESDILNAEIDQLKANLTQVKASATQAETNRQRAMILKDSGSISAQDILQFSTSAETTKAQVAIVHAQLASKQLELRYTNVVAPDDGEISFRGATLGAVASNGQELFRLIRKSRLEWRGELTAMQMSQAKQGQRLLIMLPDNKFAHGRVRQLAPTFDPKSRLGLIYADIDSGSTARAGMYASGQIVTTPDDALIVPAKSVVIRDGRSYVFKIKNEGGLVKVSASAVMIGRRQETNVEVLSGIEADEPVVVEGAGFLEDGDVVRIAPSMVSLPPSIRLLRKA